MPTRRERARNLGTPVPKLIRPPRELPELHEVSEALEAQARATGAGAALKEADRALQEIRVASDARTVRKAEDAVQNARAELVAAERAADAAAVSLEAALASHPELAEESRVREAELEPDEGELEAMSLTQVGERMNLIGSERVLRAWLASGGTSTRSLEPAHPIDALHADVLAAIVRYRQAQQPPAEPVKLKGKPGAPAFGPEVIGVGGAR